MIQRFSDFSCIDQSASSQHQALPCSAYNDIQKPLIATTLPENDIDVEPFYQKSLVKLSSCYQISFENNFMKQHQSVYQKELQKHMESQGISKGDQQFNSLRTFDSELLPKNLAQYQKLKQFLQIVVVMTPKKIMVKLLQIAVKIVGKFQEFKYDYQDQTLLLESAKKVASQLKFQNSEFMQIWAETVMLVTGQYFENPYYEGEFDGLKRPLTPSSHEDDEDYFAPSKRHKFCL